MLAVLIWWLILQLVGICAMPIAMRLLRFLPHGGSGYARQVGLLLAGYLFWLLVTLGVLHNSAMNIAFVLLLVATASLYVWRRHRQELLKQLRSGLPTLLAGEVLFALALAAFAWFRAYNPEIAATEKPMEYGFLNAILRSRYFPPADPWLSGYAISYYYFGYVLVAMLTKLSGLSSAITFNLAGATLFALTVQGAFVLVNDLVAAHVAGQKDASTERLEASPRWPGLLGAVFVAVMGNLEGVFELVRAHGGGSDALWRWLDIKNLRASAPSAAWYPDDVWWWWRASRVVHDRDVTGASMEVIDEFPFFSFLLGDLHPHVLALPFVLLMLALALNVWLMVARRQREDDGPGRAAGAWLAYDPAANWQDVGLWALLLGSLGFLNTWDYPIYLALFVVAYALARVTRGLDWAWLRDVAVLGCTLLLLGLLLYAPFYVSFRSQAGGIGRVVSIKTQVHQFAIMFGPLLWLVMGLLVCTFGASRRALVAHWRSPIILALAFVILLLGVVCVSQGWWTAALCVVLGGLGALPLAASLYEGRERRLEASTLFAATLALTGIVLAASVEFVFLRDTFGTRMNTVFKFYYQAWVLLAVASGYGLYLVVHKMRGGWLTWLLGGTFLLVAVVLVMGGLAYTVPAVVSKANAFQGRPSLNGVRHLERSDPDTYAAIQWLAQNASDDAVMLEAPGGSYSEFNWVSAYTGIPTLLGWGGHELQWRGDYTVPGQREPDIEAVYRFADVQSALDILESYGVDYIYVGPLERRKYGITAASLARMQRYLPVVYQKGETIILENPN